MLVVTEQKCITLIRCNFAKKIVQMFFFLNLQRRVQILRFILRLQFSRYGKFYDYHTAIITFTKKFILLREIRQNMQFF